MSENRQSNSHDERPRSHDARRPASPQSQAGVAARQLAVDALIRIDADGAYANLAVPALLQRSDLETRDRGFVTELVYGTTRMQRACDWLVDRFLPDPERIDVTARAWLRLGAFQLGFLDTPPHAAVGATVEAAPRKISGLCNAVLRKVATSLPVEWPSDVVRLSQPDWIFDRLTTDLGREAALGAMDAMNQSATSTTRDDGYVQDLASQWVAEAVGAGPGDVVLDMCAAPGGKATAIASTGARVVASDMRETRSGLVAENAKKLGLAADRFSVIAANGASSPFRSGTFDRVLLDAPCSGLGALRRRPDARWRINPEDIATLTELQKQLLASALDLVKPGGEVTYSVCTLTRAESIEIDEWLTKTRPDVVAIAPPDAPWIPAGRGALLLPQAEGTDGMYILKLRRPELATEATS